MKFKIAQLETIELINLTAMFNRNALTEEQKDRLDQLILAHEFYMRMFEVLSDHSFNPSLQNIVNSLKDKNLNSLMKGIG